jgi:drug/metabolite transporter (DMT)-like permease
VAAIVLVSAEGSGSLRPSDRRGVTLALGAGLGFGLFFVAVSYTHDGSGLWPIVAARVTSVTLVGSLALLRRFDATVGSRPTLALTVGAGALDVGANVLYVLAIREGLLSVVSVLSALYPVSTVVLAWAILRERFHLTQRVGLVLAVPAVMLMAT